MVIIRDPVQLRFISCELRKRKFVVFAIFFRRVFCERGAEEFEVPLDSEGNEAKIQRKKRNSAAERGIRVRNMRELLLGVFGMVLLQRCQFQLGRRAVHMLRVFANEGVGDKKTQRNQKRFRR